MKERNIIKCPYCHAEYLPSEIFMSDSFLDKPLELHKTEEGKIDYSNIEEPELSETYICDYCNKEFITTASIDYSTSYKISDYFEEEFTVEL